MEKFNILIVDDEPENIRVIANILQDTNQYNLVYALDGESALKRIEENRFDLILLDIMMNPMNGFVVCKRIKENKNYKNTPVIFLSAATDNESIFEGFLVGGVDYILKPFNPYELQIRIKSHINIKINFDNELNKAHKKLLDTLLCLANIKTGEHFDGHSNRVSQYAEVLGFFSDFSKQQINDLKIAASLHDIGKIAISDEVLNKNTSLNVKENNILKKHTTLSDEILKHSNHKTFKIAKNVASRHHEKWDGSGYPKGLIGSKIDIYSRIIALANSYDNLTTKRGSKDAWNLEDTKNFIKYESAKSFDPDLVSIFIDKFDEFEELYNGFFNN